MRCVYRLLLIVIALPANSSELTIARIFGDPALSGPTPRAVQVSPDGRRVGLLRGRDNDQHQLDLWSYDVADGGLKLRVDSKQLVPTEQLSAIEQGRRERERTADYHGIVDYKWAPDSRHVLFTLAGSLYLCDLDAPAAGSLRQLTHGGSAVIDPQVSPRGRYVSFVRDQDLWVIELGSGAQRRLTFDGSGTTHNAEAEFIAQEEMNQTHGYWWAPDDSAIAYKRFDEGAVPIARRYELYADRVEVVEQRYPAAGDPNVAVQLGLVSPAGGNTRWIDLGTDRDIYLARVDWAPSSKGSRLPASGARSEAPRPGVRRCAEPCRAHAAFGDLIHVDKPDGRSALPQAAEHFRLVLRAQWQQTPLFVWYRWPPPLSADPRKLECRRVAGSR